MNSPSHKVEVFVAAGGKLDVLMTIHGPLSLPEVYAVRSLLINLFFFKEVQSKLAINLSSTCTHLCHLTSSFYEILIVAAFVHF